MIFGLRVDADSQDWVFESFHWAIDEGLLTANTRLILPTKANFPAPSEPKRAAPALVAAIQRHLNIDVPVEVVPLDALPAQYRIDYNALSGIGGTWSSDGKTTVIAYDLAAADRPLGFLSTLVHEVMHQRLHMTRSEMPGGPEAEELSTDLHCITTGFGAIQLAGAEQVGWQGYLRQETRAFALRLFLELTGEAMPDLPPRSAKMVRQAAKLLTKRLPDVQSLRGRLRGGP
ncbi:hypothetical protein [Tropicibacter sp. S64]|uniref:hypothetical protein n=1 Tax=Tropicibacter sp. S64 TaxID=3415122 RepID=UPI003C7A9231